MRILLHGCLDGIFTSVNLHQTVVNTGLQIIGPLINMAQSIGLQGLLSWNFSFSTQPSSPLRWSFHIAWIKNLYLFLIFNFSKTFCICIVHMYQKAISCPRVLSLWISFIQIHIICRERLPPAHCIPLLRMLFAMSTQHFPASHSMQSINDKLVAITQSKRGPGLIKRLLMVWIICGYIFWKYKVCIVCSRCLKIVHIFVLMNYTSALVAKHITYTLSYYLQKMY